MAAGARLKFFHADIVRKMDSRRFEENSRMAEPYKSYFIRCKEFEIEIRRVLGE